MYRIPNQNDREYVFKGQDGQQSPLTFRYRLPTTGDMVAFQDDLVQSRVVLDELSGTGRAEHETRHQLGLAKLNLVKRVLTGWSGLEDHSGRAVAFEISSVEKLPPAIYNEFVAHLDKEIRVGREEEKN